MSLERPERRASGDCAMPFARALSWTIHAAKRLNLHSSSGSALQNAGALVTCAPQTSRTCGCGCWRGTSAQQRSSGPLARHFKEPAGQRLSPFARKYIYLLHSAERVWRRRTPSEHYMHTYEHHSRRQHGTQSSQVQ